MCAKGKEEIFRNNENVSHNSIRVQNVQVWKVSKLKLDERKFSIRIDWNEFKIENSRENLVRCQK